MIEKNNNIPKAIMFFGLEIHIGLNTKHKLYCRCKTGLETCGYCLGYPGFLPMINMEAINTAKHIINTLHGRVADKFMADRKPYIYPDLPKKFQITQLRLPIGTNGWIQCNENNKITILNFCLEEDAGRNLTNRDLNVIDINFKRCGNPLLELTTDYRNVVNVDYIIMFLRILKHILQYYDYSKADVLHGTFRFDLNLSLQTTNYISPRVEVKNINSIAEIKKIVNYEYHRILEEKPNISTTRGWNGNKTFFLRNKTIYSFWPENDISYFIIDRNNPKTDNIYDEIIKFCKVHQLKLLLSDVFKLFIRKMFIMFKHIISNNWLSHNFFFKHYDILMKWSEYFEIKEILEILDLLRRFQPISVFLKDNIMLINESIIKQNKIQDITTILQKKLNTQANIKEIDVNKLLESDEFKKYFIELSKIQKKIIKQRKINFIIGKIIQYIKKHNGRINTSIIKNQVLKHHVKNN